jgi:hypothetical protein
MGAYMTNPPKQRRSLADALSMPDGYDDVEFDPPRTGVDAEPIEAQINVYAIFGRMLGIEPGILRTVTKPWQDDPSTPPISYIEFSTRVADATYVAGQLNNTNLTELAIREAFDPSDIPDTLPTRGRPRRADEE